MDEREFFRLTTKRIIRSMAENILMSKTISKQYAESANKAEVENEIDAASEEITDRLIKRLNESGKKLSQTEFYMVAREIINQYLSEKNANRSSS